MGVLQGRKGASETALGATDLLRKCGIAEGTF